MNETTADNTSSADSFKDSRADWMIFSLLHKQEPELSRKIIARVVPKIRQLKIERRISTWHIHSGRTVGLRDPSTGSTRFLDPISFRIKPISSERAFVETYLLEVFKELAQEDLVVCAIDRDEAFEFTEGGVIERYGSWESWQTLMEIDELLSEIAYRISNQPTAKWRDFFLHEMTIHLLFNMLGNQELFKPYYFQQGRHRELMRLLTEGSAEFLRNCLDGMGYEKTLAKVPLKSILFFDPYERNTEGSG